MVSDVFCSRLKALRGDKSQEDLAAAIGETRAIVRNWELGKSEIKHPALKKLAEYFHVSTDYLLGLSDTPTNNKDLQFICEYTGLNPRSVYAIKWALDEDSAEIANDFMGEYFESFIAHLVAIQREVADAQFTLDMAKFPEKKEEIAVNELPISHFRILPLFQYEKYCREIPQSLLGSDLLSNYEYLLESALYADRELEVSDDGKHTED